jgi:two-component system, cell cycle response regulator
LVVAERIRQKISGEPFDNADGADIGVTVSIGIASLVSGRDTADDLVRRSDEALYLAKRAGRNRVAAAA